MSEDRRSHGDHGSAWKVIGTFIGFALVAGYFLVMEHRAHLEGVLNYLPILLLLACPLMHLFMHHDHGGRGAHACRPGRRTHCASRRTRRANASVHGLGRQKHIYLHDTLIQRLGADEILAVVAHEAGHARLSHVQQYLAALAILGLAAALAISVLYDRLDGSVAERLAMIILLIPSASFCVRPILFKLSRRFEYEADAFAADRIGPQPMIRALEQLYASNAGVPSADTLYVAFHASHPVACHRLASLRLLEGKTAAHSEPGVLMT